MVEADSRPDAFRICVNDGELESVQVRLVSQQKGSKDWLNVIGNQDYYLFNECELVAAPGPDYVAIFISLGYRRSRGVNHIQIVFAPSYDNTDASQEVSIEMGKITNQM